MAFVGSLVFSHHCWHQGLNLVLLPISPYWEGIMAGADYQRQPV